MITKLQSIFGRFDWVLFFAVLVLVALGITTIWSVALSRGANDLGLVYRQLVALVIGLAFIVFFSFANYRQFKNFSFLIWILACVLLIAVLIFGRTIRGTTGWLSVFGLNFQPVEFAKFALIVFVAKYLSDHPRTMFGLREFFTLNFFSAVLIGLVLLQPDLGSSVVLIAVWFGLLALSRINRKYILTMIFGALIAITATWFFLAPYQKERILTFVDPSRDPLGRGYNVTQAIIAVGAGGLFGRGLGFGSQSQLRFLPESQTDFIFAVIAEEFGFVGVALILIAFVLIFYRIIKLAKTAEDDFTALFALGVCIFLFCQFLINVGMNLGLVPVTGIVLPFVSYGGSSLLISLLMISILESIALRRSLTGKQ